MNIVIATNNAHKVKEYSEILNPLGITCLSLKDVNIDVDPDENGNSFAENSMIKAKEIAKYTDLAVLGDDSGLIIDAMPNELGLYSKRFMEDRPYEEKMAAIIERLKNNVKTARFVCVITLTNYNNQTVQFEGICEGSISSEIKGVQGFGYDPVFIPNGYDKTMGELGEEVKNKVSHRGLASIKLVKYLKESMGE